MTPYESTRKRSGLTALAAAAAIFTSISPAMANNIVVNSLADSPVSGACTLRDAIQAAATNAAVNGCAAGAGANNITFSVSGTIQLAGTLRIVDPPADLTIDASGQNVTITGNDTFTLLSIEKNTGPNTLWSATLKNLTFSHGYSPSIGGAVYEGSSAVNVVGCTFLNNSANGSYGGGAIAEVSGLLTISDSTFTANTSPLEAGAIFLSSGQTVISNSTFSENRAGSTDGVGGAIVNADGLLTILNSTFSGNVASAAGAIFNFGFLTMGNTILANSSSGSDCFSFGGSNINPIIATGVNIVGDGSCAIPGMITGDPKLGPLADNGGPTQTMGLLPGSPAIGTANLGVCAAPPVNNLDQRGQPRSVNGTCDIGAYQTNPTFPFTGFFSPVANAPALNGVKAGSAVPMVFSLGGNQGLGIFASGYPVAQQVSCSTGVSTDITADTVSAGGSTLTYDPQSNTYTYVWKTQKNWAGTCQQFVMRLSDGSYHMANFQFK